MAVGATLSELTEEDIPSLIEVGKRIWVAHYVPILGTAQVEYMTGMRFTETYLRGYIGAAEKWLYLLRLHGTLVGYCSYALTAAAGEIKLEQLYLLPELHGQGLGGLMLRHVAARARELGGRTLMLQVNKHNTGSVDVYKKTGFTVREAAVFDIGQGFVMDDYVMEKRL